jgi:diaminohydroxyphosphoribosylaminopyrimidine deaminase/5-amino-6-(5-phosphoribosylamino)uracil reductase
MYVTLEPCAHQGRQPPCTEALLEAGIGRVVIASEDPSEKAAGRGPGMLRDGGVEVEFAAGAEAGAARLLNQPFRKHARTGLPLVTLKMAMSLDGQTSTGIGQSKWISGESSRALVHRWRAESDAIAVGIGTVLADDPLLTSRHPDARQPLRIVFDSQARLPLDSQLLSTLDQSPVLVVTTPDADPTRSAALREAGAETLVAPGTTSADRIHSALTDLGRRGITSLFLEGGRTLASAFTTSGNIDETRIFIAPVLLGDSATVPRPRNPEGEPENEHLARRASPPGSSERRTALSSSTENVGEDVLITARYREW